MVSLSECCKKITTLVLALALSALVACAAAKPKTGQWPSTTTEVPASLEETYMNARKLFSLGEDKLRRKEYKEAISLFNSGILLVGDSYYTLDLIDDTDLHVGLARHEERKGNDEIAANLLRSVLHDRLSSLRRRTK